MHTLPSVVGIPIRGQINGSARVFFLSMTREKGQITDNSAIGRTDKPAPCLEMCSPEHRYKCRPIYHMSAYLTAINEWNKILIGLPSHVSNLASLSPGTPDIHLEISRFWCFCVCL